MKNKIKIPDEDFSNAKPPNKFQLLLLLVFIPAVFILIAAYTVTSLLDIDLAGKVKQAGISIPFVADSKEKESAVSTVKKQEAAFTEENMLKKNEQIADLEQQLESLQNKMEKIESENEGLKEDLHASSEEKEIDDGKKSEIIAVFKEMSGKAAAPVLMNMTEGEAVRIMSQLPPEKVAQILEKMPADTAAKYAELISRQNS